VLLPPPRACTDRVYLLTALFSRLLDLDNVEAELVRKLTESEAQEAVHRLGWLALFNPLRPERRYWFDLRCEDHRAMLHVLVKMQARERGEVPTKTLKHY
jgi:hypothetical protein